MSIAFFDAIVTGKISYQMEVILLLFSSCARFVGHSSPTKLVLLGKVIYRHMGYGRLYLMLPGHGDQR